MEQVSGSSARTALPLPVSTAYNVANQLTQWGTATLSYDLNGNLTRDGANGYTWDARNQLVTISGGTAASFQYDAFGRRIGKTIGEHENYFYDGVNTVQQQSGARGI